MKQTTGTALNSQQGLGGRRVVLMQPSEPFGRAAEIPASLIGLAAGLREQGCQVEILDSRRENLSVQEAVARVRSLQPDLVGVTGLNAAYRFLRDFIHEYKRRAPSTPLVAGGHFIASQPELILPRVPIDAACTGEGEVTIAPLVRALLGEGDLGDVPNIAYLRDGKLLRTPNRLLESLDGLPFPAYDLLPMEEYIAANHITLWNDRYFPLYTGRGCVHHCYYCGRAFDKPRKVPPVKVLEWMDRLAKEYGIRSFCFGEDSLFSPRSWIVDLCRLLVDGRRGYTFAAGGCAEQIDEELIDLLMAAGCRQIDVGVEHFDPAIQRGFFRNSQSAHIERVFRLFQEKRLFNNGFNLLWGHPLDTVPGFLRTFQVAMDLAERHDIAHFGATSLVIYPNSKLREDALHRGGIRDYEDYMYGSGGYAPYVNLTGEDDDHYRALFVEQMHWERIETLQEALRFRRSNSEVDETMVASWREEIRVRWEELETLLRLLALPSPEREKRRQDLERLLQIPMHDPNVSYFRRYGCFEEILAMPASARIVVHNPLIIRQDGLTRLFNSIREANLRLAGFSRLDPAPDEYEGHPVLPLEDIARGQPEHFGAFADEAEARTLRQELPRGINGVFLPRQRLARRPWMVPFAVASYRNRKYWRVVVENGEPVWRKRDRVAREERS